MYESDEWYLQYDFGKDPRVIVKINGQAKSPSGNQTMADTEDLWDLDGSISENESSKIETER